MTTEQKEAIDRLNYINRAYDYNNYYSTYDLDCIDVVLNLIQEQEKQISAALDLAFEYAQIDGGHHKMWVIDQMVRKLTGNNYKEWVDNYEYDEETEEEYDWDTGIAP